MNRNEEVRGIFLDLTNAFDIVYHDELVSEGTEYQW